MNNQMNAVPLLNRRVNAYAKACRNLLDAYEAHEKSLLQQCVIVLDADGADIYRGGFMEGLRAYLAHPNVAPYFASYHAGTTDEEIASGAVEHAGLLDVVDQLKKAVKAKAKARDLAQDRVFWSLHEVTRDEPESSAAVDAAMTRLNEINEETFAAFAVCEERFPLTSLPGERVTSIPVHLGPCA